MNLRSLNTSSVLLGESRETLEAWEDILTRYSEQLNIIHQHIRIVKHDSTLLNDSLNTILHGQMRAVYERSLSLDSLVHTSTIKINTLRNRVSISYLLNKDLVSAINDRQQAISQLMWKQEEAPFFESCETDYDSSFAQVVQGSLNRMVRVVRIFMRTTWDVRFINLPSDHSVGLVSDHPVLSIKKLTGKMLSEI
jgi:hypothetical protein